MSNPCESQTATLVSSVVYPNPNLTLTLTLTQVRAVLAKKPEERRLGELRDVAVAMRSMPLFRPHSQLQHLYMAKVMQRVVAQRDAVLCREGQVGNVSLCVLSGCVMQHFNSSVAQAIKHAAGRTLEDMITRGSFMALMKAKLAGDEPPVDEPSDGASYTLTLTLTLPEWLFADQMGSIMNHVTAQMNHKLAHHQH